jgi:citrate lyase subunit gamma (acyl carrier protein)
MKVVDTGVAGTMESSDIMVTIKPKEQPGIEIELTSSVEKQFGEQIKSVMTACLQEKEITQAYVIAVDKGALDCVVKARTFAAIHRACKNTDYHWEA